MIRQSISCDVCGAEKRQTNHWFVAYTHGDELRVRGWSAQGRLRAGAKHLCGQTCLHKLVDDFIAGNMSSRAQAGTSDAAEIEAPMAGTDASLTSKAAYATTATFAGTVAGLVPDRVLGPTQGPAQSLSPSQIAAAVIAIAPSRAATDMRQLSAPPFLDEMPNYTSRHLRAEAWERERERERHATLGRRKTS